MCTGFPKQCMSTTTATTTTTTDWCLTAGAGTGRVGGWRFAGWCWAGTRFVTRAWVRHAPRETYHTFFQWWFEPLGYEQFENQQVFCSISNPKNSLRMENMWNVQMDQAWNECIPSWNMTARIPSSSDLLITCFKNKHFWKKRTQIQILSSSRANSVLCFSFGGVEVRTPACQFDLFLKGIFGF